MSVDPMDSPPGDHGADRYGYVELRGAPDNVAPNPEYVDSLMAKSCQDCNVNLFLRWRPDLPESWGVTVAHDEGCPTYLRLEREGKLSPEQPHP